MKRNADQLPENGLLNFFSHLGQLFDTGKTLNQSYKTCIPMPSSLHPGATEYLQVLQTSMQGFIRIREIYQGVMPVQLTS